MSFASLLRHTVTVYRDVAVLDAGEPTYNELGQPITAEQAVATWRCRIDPQQTNREVPEQSQAGPVVSDHVLFGFRAGSPRSADRVVASDGRAFEVVADPEDGGGAGHHVEVRCRLITSEDPALPDVS